MKNITYTESNGIRYPNLTLPEQIDYPLGKYSNLRLDFMKKHRKGRYTTSYSATFRGKFASQTLRLCVVKVDFFKIM